MCHPSNDTKCSIMLWPPLLSSLSMSVGRHWQRCYHQQCHNNANGVSSKLSQRCQRCYHHSCNRRCVALRSHSPRQRSTPACFGQGETWSGTTVTLPCLPRVTPLRKALFARGPGPSTVRPSSWANLSSFYSCSSDDDRLSSPLAPTRPSRCRCVRG